MSKIICQVYRSAKREQMYLYVKKEEGLRRVPEPLLALFGKAVEAMVLVLTADKKLARVDAQQVMQQIEEKGFYLQMPPAADSEMQQMAEKNSKLAR